MDHRQRFLDIFRSSWPTARSLQARGQIAVLVEVADDVRRSRALSVQTLTLSARQDVGKARGDERNLSKEGFSISSCSPRPLHRRYRDTVEEGAEIEFVEGIRGFGVSGTFSVSFFMKASSVIFAGGAFVGQFLENRVRNDLLGNHLAQFQAVERQYVAPPSPLHNPCQCRATVALDTIREQNTGRGFSSTPQVQTFRQGQNHLSRSP